MVVGTLQDGLDLSILTNNILKTNNLVVNGLTLHYDPRELTYKYLVKPLYKGYIGKNFIMYYGGSYSVK